MKRLRIYLSIFLTCIILKTCESKGNAKVLMVSFDGFRWDYPSMFKTPNFDKLRMSGVTAEKGVKPVFVTNTFTNHFSIVTGVYPESHGIVDNNMFNKTSNAIFSISKSTDSLWWQDGIPIWLTAQRQGLRTGVYFWVGSEMEIRGHRPTIYHKYKSSVKFSERVDTVVEWLKQDKVDLALLYFHEPDHTGHGEGISSPKFRDMVEGEVDKTLGYLLKQLDDHQLTSQVNLLVVSDHGMTNFTEKMIVLEDHVNKAWLRRVVPGVGATVGIFPAPGISPEQIYDRLKNVSKNVRVVLKDKLPDALGYKKHDRIAPVLAFADEGFLVSRNAKTSNLVGFHGFSNELQSMRPIFLARGPAFKVNFISPSFGTLDIYPLLCHLLSIQPETNNGSFSAVTAMLRSDGMTYSAFTSVVIFAVLFTVHCHF